MAQIGIASRRTVVAASQTDAAVAGGEPVIIHGILCSNPHSSAQTFLFEKFGTTTAELTVSVAAGDSEVIYVQWIADDGLQVTTPGNSATVTVWHSHPGR